MNNRLIRALGLTLLVCWISAAAAVEVPRLEERVVEQLLDNGLRVVVVERHTAPVFFAIVTFRVGSCNEVLDHTGLSHFLEHMMGKGTRTIGTENYREEVPIMEELDWTAVEMRDIAVALDDWRLERFDEYATRLKAELPEEVRRGIGADEAAGWRELLKGLPTTPAELPEDWQRSPWMLTDQERDYWTLYRWLVELRARMAELTREQRQYIKQAELDGIFDVHGARMRNAMTGNDATAYIVGLPSNCLELWMFLESDRFQNPVFREFYSEREVVMEELRMYDNEPGSLLYQGLARTAFQAHPYGRPIIGWMSDVQRTVRSDMEEHYRKYYAPNNCQITIVGDIEAGEVFQFARRYFGDWKAHGADSEVTVREPEQTGERRVAVEYDAEPRLLMAYHAPVAPHPDAYPLEMLDYILSSGRTSRFYRSIFVEQGLTAGPPWSGAPDGRYDELFTIGATPKAPHTLQEVEEAIYAELDRLKKEPVTEWELDKARNNFRSWQLERLRSNEWLAFTLSGAFATSGDWRTITEDFNRLMAVTPDDIQRVARDYFTARNRTVASLVRPEKSGMVEETGEEGQ